MATIILLLALSTMALHFVRHPIKKQARSDQYRSMKFERTRSEQAALRSAVYW